MYCLFIVMFYIQGKNNKFYSSIFVNIFLTELSEIPTETGAFIFFREIHHMLTHYTAS